VLVQRSARWVANATVPSLRVTLTAMVAGLSNSAAVERRTAASSCMRSAVSSVGALLAARSPAS
jgi:hypothetical protein